MNRYANQLERRVAKAWRSGEASQVLAEADRDLRAFVVERPFAAVALAVATGYIMARTINVIR